MKKRNLQSGITIVETIVTIGIVGIFIVAASTFVLFILNSENRVGLTQETNWQGQRVLSALETAVADADNIISPNAGETANSLTLTYESGSTMNFYISSGRLYKQTNSATAEAVTPETVVVESVDFTNSSLDSGVLVSVVVTLSATTGKETFEQTFYTSVNNL